MVSVQEKPVATAQVTLNNSFGDFNLAQTGTKCQAVETIEKNYFSAIAF